MWKLTALVLYFSFAGLAWAGEWSFGGLTAATGDRPGFYSAGISQKDIRFTLICEPASRSIGLRVKAGGALAAAELGDRAAKAQAGGGAFDLLIKDTAYPRTATYDSASGTLLFTQPVGKDGPLLEDIMSAKQLVISNSPLKLSFPLSGSRGVICKALDGCGIEQSGCLAKGF